MRSIRCGLKTPEGGAAVEAGRNRPVIARTAVNHDDHALGRLAHDDLDIGLRAVRRQRTHQNKGENSRGRAAKGGESKH